MLSNKLFCLCLCLIGLNIFTINDVNAQVEDTNEAEVLAFSLDDLMNTKVTVSSKKEEKIAEAPGMVTAYSNKEIQRLGYYTVADLANITPGYSAFTAFGEQTLETRGLKSGSWNNNKQLFLIDGIPINHVRANSAPIDNQIPLLFANTIEFMRGPASALYGTGAFYGVINAKSKELKSFGTEGVVKISMGTYHVERRAMASVSSKNQHGLSHVNVGYYGRDASLTRLGATDSLRNSDSRRNIDDALTYFTYFNHTLSDGALKGLGIGLIYFNKTSHGGEFWNTQTSPNNDIQWEEAIPYLKYTREITNQFSVSSYLKYNYSKEKSNFERLSAYDTLNNNKLYTIDSITGNPISLVNVSGYDYRYSNIEGLLEGNLKLTNFSNIVLGLNYDTRKELSSPSSYEFSAASPNSTISNSTVYTFNNNYIGTDWYNTYSAYAQYQGKFDFLKGTILTLGFRGDIGITPTNKYQQLSPRIGLVQKITNQINFKMLYGQAFRAPGIKEIGTNAAIKNEVIRNGGDASGIATVGPELIRSVEFGLNYTVEKLSVSWSVFYNKTLNALDGVKYYYLDHKGGQLSPNIFRNIDGGYTSYGGELEVKFAPTQQFFVSVNHALAKAQLNDTMQFVNVPTQKSNAMFSYTSTGKIKLVTALVYRQIYGFYVSKAVYGNSEIKGYSNVDLNFTLPIAQSLGVELQFRNVFNTKWYQPAEGGKMMDMGLSGRRALLSLMVTF